MDWAILGAVVVTTAIIGHLVLGGQLKTGQLGSLQNRPTDVAWDLAPGSVCIRRSPR